MAQNPADDLVNSIEDTVSSPLNAVHNVYTKVKGAIDSLNPTVHHAPPADTSWHDSMVKSANESFAKQQNANKNTSTTKPAAKPAATPKYHKGTDYVPKTGPAVLKKGEAVLNTKDAKNYREGKMASHKTYDVSDELAGKKEEKPPKEIDHIKTKKGKSGGYIHTHVHTHPEHHPNEDHVSQDQDGMVAHMMEHMGEPNPGEAEADAGQSGIPSAQGAAPQPTPGAQAGM